MINITGHIESLQISNLGTELSRFRLFNEAQITRVKVSLESLGMLHPLVVLKHNGSYEIIDGFKRLYASEKLEKKELNCRILDVSLSQGKALQINFNRKTSSIIDYEEACIIYSLKTQDGLTGREIANCLSQSTSWVSRRLSIIEKLDPRVADQIKMGLIRHSHAREIIKLPRGNQHEISGQIIKLGLNSRDSSLLVDAWTKAKNRKDQSFIVSNAKKVIESLKTKEGPVNDPRLSKAGNKLLLTLEILHRQQCMLISQLSSTVIQKLAENEKIILRPKLMRIHNNTPQFIGSIKKYIQQ